MRALASALARRRLAVWPASLLANEGLGIPPLGAVLFAAAGLVPPILASAVPPTADTGLTLGTAGSVEAGSAVSWVPPVADDCPALCWSCSCAGALAMGRVKAPCGVLHTPSLGGGGGTLWLGLERLSRAVPEWRSRKRASLVKPVDRSRLCRFDQNSVRGNGHAGHA